MKILWVKTDFLHPTTKGGHIRTLEMLKRLHQRHEIHYVAFSDPAYPDQARRAALYSSQAYPVPIRVADKRSPRFLAELLWGLVSRLPVVINRWKSAAMRRTVSRLISVEGFDCIVSDFLFPAANLERLDRVVLFQHNVESAIWLRYAEHATDSLRRFYFGLQAKRMLSYEGSVCTAVRKVIAVSEVDAELMQKWFGVPSVAHIPTGVDVDYFRPTPSPATANLVFIGSMDWLPNVYGIEWFVREVLPLIRRERPSCTLDIVGRSPTATIEAFGRTDPGIRVSGTVPDVRPYLWGANVSIVPLQIGGGTRLKIYESMAEGVPVVSTTVGAEGLSIHPPVDIRIGDDAASFARACLDLLNDPEDRARVSAAARDLVTREFSWDEVTRQFEAALLESSGR